MAHVADTNPYPWPYDGAAADGPLQPDRLAAVVCGAQPHWLAMVEQPASLRPLLALVDALRSAGVLVVWIRHGASSAGTRPIDRTLPVVGTEDWRLVADPDANDLVIDAPAHNAFAELTIDAELRARGIDRLVMIGIGTESVVSGTNRDANDRGYECLTLTDGVLHHDATTGAASLSSICMSGGIFGAVGTSAPLLAALAGASTPER
jgi:nicotinamidase-related amidase